MDTLDRLKKMVNDLEGQPQVSNALTDVALISLVRYYISDQEPTIVGFLISQLPRPRPVENVDGSEVERFGYRLRKAEEGRGYILTAPDGEERYFMSLTSAAEFVQRARGLSGKTSGPKFWGISQ